MGEYLKLIEETLMEKNKYDVFYKNHPFTDEEHEHLTSKGWKVNKKKGEAKHKNLTATVKKVATNTEGGVGFSYSDDVEEGGPNIHHSLPSVTRFHQKLVGTRQ